MFKDPHLRRRSDLRIDRSHRRESHRITEALGHSARPRLELRARPLEAMVAMPETTRRQRWPSHVVLRVRRRHDYRFRPRELERDALECRETRRIQMLDHLDDGGGIKPRESLIAIRQTSVQQRDALPLLAR